MLNKLNIRSTLKNWIWFSTKNYIAEKGKNSNISAWELQYFAISLYKVFSLEEINIV